MAIVTKKKVQAAQGAGSQTSTHFPNETTKPVEDSDQAVLNHMAPEKLYDPDELGVPGSTHFNNEETFSKKSNRMNGGKTTAGTKTEAKPAKKHAQVPLAPTSGKKHPAKTKANIDEEMDETEDEDVDGEFPFGGEDSGVKAATKVKADSDCEPGLQDSQHMANDEDPAAGYLPQGGELTADIEDLDEEDDAEFEDGAGATPQSLLEVDDGWNPDEEEHPEISAEFDDDEDEEDEEDEDEDELEVEAASESMDLVDVDGTDDEGDDTVFATVGTKIHVLKANRIVASIGKKLAVRAGHGDVYLSDQFQEVTRVEMSKHGLRAGLRKMGFTLAKINVGAQDVLNKRVEAKANKVTAAIRRSTKASQDSFEQCLAIASVGVNRGRFQDVENTLMTAMTDELRAAGVRGASRLVKSVFAAHGVDYAKSILAVATKLQAMPEQVRNSFSDALNMTRASADSDMDEEDELFGDEAGPDFQSENASAEEEFNDDVEDEFETPETVHAALARPAIRRMPDAKRTQVSAKRAGYSVTAAAVLSGDAPLPFGI
jgi:hypothetical protein